MTDKIIGSTIFSGLFFLTLVVVSFFAGDTNLAVALNFTVLIFGASTDWVVGIAVSPYSAAEQTQFTGISKSVAVFLSGYLAGKIDRMIN